VPRNRKIWPYEYRCPDCGAEYTAPEANKKKHVEKVREPAHTEIDYGKGTRSRPVGRKVRVPASTFTIFHGYKCWDCETILKRIIPFDPFVDFSDENDEDLDNEIDEQADALKEKQHAEWEERWNCFIGKIVCHMEFGLGAMVRFGYDVNPPEVLIDFFELARPQNSLGLRIVRLGDLNKSISQQEVNKFFNNAATSNSRRYPIELIRSVMNNLFYGDRKQFLNSEIVSILKQVSRKSSQEDEVSQDSWMDWSANNLPPDFNDAKAAITKALRISRGKNLTFQEASIWLENQGRR